MPAMAMPFRLADARLLGGLRPGTMVEFEMAVGGKASGIRNIKPLPAGNAILEEGRRVELPAPEAQVAVGAAVPDFTLTDQKGRRVRLSDFRNHTVAVNFLYTRCPVAEVCPRLAATFARIHRRLEQESNLILLSITLDPHHDTPEVLDRYSRIWEISPEGWRFLTGSAEEVRRAAEIFGVIYWPEEGIVTHTSAIGVIDRNGRLHARVDGLSFDAKQLGDLIASALFY